jgi:hypothetical protein
MKKLCILFALFISAVAQSQGTTGIFKFKWNIDNRLTNTVIINNTGNSDLFIPTNLYDSVISRVEYLVTQELHSDTKWIYPINRRGKELKTNSTSSQVGGLPRGTKRQAMRSEYLEYYVKFRITVGLNKTFTFGGVNASYSRLKPYVRVKMKAYGIDRRLKKRKNIRLGNFDSIGSFDFNVGGTTVTQTNGLPINEVLDMVFKGLKKFEEKAQ